jgi:molecular chaperone GrpE
MSDEAKQPDNPLSQTDQPIAVEEDNSGLESTVTEVDSQGTNIESQQEDDLIPQGATEKAVIDAGVMSDMETAEGVTPETLADADLAAMLGLRVANQALEAQLDELNQQFESLKTQSMRMAADFENFRRRTAKEKEDLEHLIKGNTLKELLPVVDNFERARSQIKPQNEGEMGIHRSYQGVYKQLVDCLKRIGVSPMRAEGTEFDPNLHEAVMREPTNEYSEGVVIEELMRGYLLGERVLRHAMVKVAAAPMPVVTSEDETKEPG